MGQLHKKEKETKKWIPEYCHFHSYFWLIIMERATTQHGLDLSTSPSPSLSLSLCSQLQTLSQTANIPGNPLS